MRSLTCPENGGLGSARSFGSASRPGSSRDLLPGWSSTGRRLPTSPYAGWSRWRGSAGGRRRVAWSPRSSSRASARFDLTAYTPLLSSQRRSSFSGTSLESSRVIRTKNLSQSCVPGGDNMRRLFPLVSWAPIDLQGHYALIAFGASDVRVENSPQWNANFRETPIASRPVSRHAANRYTSVTSTSGSSPPGDGI